MNSPPRMFLNQLILVIVFNTIIFADDCVSKQEYELLNEFMSARFQELASKFDDTVRDLTSRLKKSEASAAEMKVKWQDANDQIKMLMKNRNSTDEYSASKRLLQTTTQDRYGAFYARLDNSLAVNNGQTIIFDKEYTDMSSAYHETNGVYMAPETGVYVFTWTIGVRHSWVITELVVEGSRRGYSFADSDLDKDDYGSATQLVVVKVTKGQNVWIRKVEGVGIIDGFRATYDTTFSGWMLYPLD